MAKTQDRYSQILNMLDNDAEADLQRAILSLDLLSNSGVGVGEHSTKDFWDNCREALDLFVDANDRLDGIKALREL